jgi:long-subunit acyl-CoA synthetase (AMP-forming)
VLQLSEEDVALSFLPLSHSFERLVSYVLLSGVTVVFAESSTPSLVTSPW